MIKNVSTRILLLFLLFLAGCLNYTQITTIKTDGSGKMFVHYWMFWNSGEDSLVIDKLGIFNRDSILVEFSSSHNNISNIEVYKDYSDSTIHAKVDLTFDSIDSLNNTQAFHGANFSITEGSEETKIFSQYIQPFITGYGFETNSFIITYVYYLPGEIIGHNATSISNNKLTWEFNLEEVGGGKVISAAYVPFKLKETPVWIYIIAFLMILMVSVFMFKKKKS